jgi:hypothetical protein
MRALRWPLLLVSLLVCGCASAPVHTDGMTGSVAWHATEFHIVVDRRVLPWVDCSSFRQITYR